MHSIRSRDYFRIYRKKHFILSQYSPSLNFGYIHQVKREFYPKTKSCSYYFIIWRVKRNIEILDGGSPKFWKSKIGTYRPVLLKVLVRGPASMRELSSAGVNVLNAPPHLMYPGHLDFRFKWPPPLGSTYPLGLFDNFTPTLLQQSYQPRVFLLFV